jgi:hypothetical protein
LVVVSPSWPNRFAVATRNQNQGDRGSNGSRVFE